MKVGIIGCGYVGSSAAYAMVLRGAASELVLIDVNSGLARAQAEDILHATPFASSVRISAGEYKHLKGARAVILACGAAQRPGESRLQLLERNANIFKKVISQLLIHCPDSLFVVASNPVDIMTLIVSRMQGIREGQVLGSGTILDTARFRSLVGDHFGVAPQSVHAYVLGEHGDSEVLIWSSARIGGIALQEFANQVGRPLTPETKKRIDQGVRHAAFRIIDGKGATYYGIGAGITRIIQAVRDDERAVLTLSTPVHDREELQGVSLSLPRILGADGVISTLYPVLSFEETLGLTKSAELLREAALEISL